MAKINMDKLRELRQSGKTQKECADFFDSSIPAICQREKKDRLQNPHSEVFKRLSPREKGFVISKVQGKTNISAVKANFETTTDASAKSLGSALMAKDNIKKAISEIMQEEGLSRRYRVRRLKACVDSADLNVTIKGLDQSWKLDGSYAPIQVEYKPYDPAEVNALLDELRRQIESWKEQDVVDGELV
jgi:transcriptional regulator with XRE-family HTH domain